MPVDEGALQIDKEELEPFVGYYYSPTLDAHYEMKFIENEKGNLEGLAMYVITEGKTSEEPRFVFVPDPEKEGSLLWKMNDLCDTAAEIHTADEGFIFSDIKAV